MCMSSVSWTTKAKPKSTVRWGWKGVSLRSNNSGTVRVYAACQLTPVGNSIQFKQSTWLKARGGPIEADDNTLYQSGFHIYHTRRAALQWGNAVVRVKYRQVVATGRQAGYVVVAKQMFIAKSEVKRVWARKA